MRWLAGSMWLAIVAVATTAASNAVEGNLPLPDTAEAARQVIAQDCPDCLTKGVTACGTADVKYGMRFARNFFTGEPLRGYLPAFRMSGRDFEELARRLPHAALIETVRARFADTPLVVVEAGFASARVIPAPLDVTVAFPDTLHQCLQDAAKPWGCCVAADCSGECCEKSLGSPAVTLHWNDMATGETLTFSFGHSAGSSTLRRTAPGGKTLLYWCLTDEPGLLR